MNRLRKTYDDIMAMPLSEGRRTAVRMKQKFSAYMENELELDLNDILNTKPAKAVTKKEVINDKDTKV